MFEALGRLISRRRAVVLTAIIAATSLSIAMAFDLKFNFTPQAIFAGDPDGRAEFSEAFKARFAYEDTVFLVLLRAPEGGPDVLDPEALGWQLEVAEAIKARPDVTRVASLATSGLPRQHATEPGVIETSPLVRKTPVTPEVASEARRALEEAKLIEGQLVSVDRRLAVVAVFLDPDRREIEDLQESTDAIKTLTAARPPPKGFEVDYGGIPELRTHIVTQLREEQMVILPLAALVMAILMVLLFRRPSGVVLPMLGVGIGASWLVTAMVALDQHINIINNIIFVLLGIIGLADAVHIVSRYGEEVRNSPTDPVGAAVRTLKHLGFACLLTTSTTVVGFLSLLVARTDLLRAFAWQAGLGVTLVYLALIFFLTATLPLMRPVKPGFDNVDGAKGPLERVIDAMARAVIARPIITLVLGLGLMAGALGVSYDINVDSYVLETFEEDDPQYRTTREIEEQLGGFMPLEISLEAEEGKTFHDPDLYAKVAAFEKFAAAQQGVLQTRSYVDFHQEMRVALIGDASARTTLPPSGEKGVRQIYQIQELIDSAGAELGFREYMSTDFDHARVRVRIADVGSRRILVLGKDLEDKLAELFGEGSGVKATVTGEGYVASQGLDSFIRDLFYSLLAASVVIFAMMTLLFGSLRTGLISILPNIMPLVFTLGYIGIRGYDMNTTNVIVFSIGLGLAVNDTIHFLTRFREEEAECDDIKLAIRRTFLGSGRPIVLTSLLLVSGMLVILASDFVPTQRFAELTAVTIFGALWGDLLVLPACLMLFWKKKSRLGGEEPAEAEG